MNGMIVALIGVVGTLSGTLLGWILNSQSYRVGKTKIYATLVQSIELPAISLDGKNPKTQQNTQPKYLLQCIASNSRQIPAILDNFHVEMTLERRAKPIILSVYKPEIEYSELNGRKFGVQLALPRQLILPHTLHEFTFKVDYNSSDILYSRLVLVAFNEKHKRKRFLLHDGLKIKQPPKQAQ